MEHACSLAERFSESVTLSCMYLYGSLFHKRCPNISVISSTVLKSANTSSHIYCCCTFCLTFHQASVSFRFLGHPHTKTKGAAEIWPGHRLQFVELSKYCNIKNGSMDPSHLNSNRVLLRNTSLESKQCREKKGNQCFK